ncbi:hypothetical protein [Anaeromyxobacter dehalogenans]|nr:hypothetical protein [Anaeromyxobacter dehalogenans]
MRRASLALCLAALACSRSDPEARARVLGREDRPHEPAAAAFDPEHPEAALALDADEAARRLGAFDWTAAAEWTVSAPGEEARQVHVTEHHQLRQSATGEFEVRAEIDPGLGAGSSGGKHVIWTGGATYARALPAPFRERPTDRGRDARRFRDESFRLAGTVAALYGPALRLEPAGEARLLGRAARRYRLSLAPAAKPPAPQPPPPGAPAPDPDTARRLAFLQGRVPVAADGELLADAETGVPLRVRLSGAFEVPNAPGVKARLELLAEVKALGGAVGPVAAPAGALPDERKPAGPSTALEAAGLKKRGEEPARPAEPADEGE